MKIDQNTSNHYSALQEQEIFSKKLPQEEILEERKVKSQPQNMLASNFVNSQEESRTMKANKEALQVQLQMQNTIASQMFSVLDSFGSNGNIDSNGFTKAMADYEVDKVMKPKEKKEVLEANQEVLDDLKEEIEIKAEEAVAPEENTNAGTTENTENVENSDNAENVENVENAENAENSENSENKPADSPPTDSSINVESSTSQTPENPIEAAEKMIATTVEATKEASMENQQPASSANTATTKKILSPPTRIDIKV